ncbi:FBD-associated F-box protein At4g10400-like [Vicia villosa]|uniref:FBD-associated F-box protein At4g10400-like n=1 Tax=Vicia villosa TaxID=3911 RepID=UPI00273B4F8A|nr:FBD-associated F-box protein At4g10400-like [Vicia villosa]XP_058749672.1 FBD-associated F-box protein At4g10400-like [Vicia villosa]
MNSQPIRAFHLNCCHSELLLFNHDQWIEAAKLRGVKDLQLSMFHFYTAFKMYMAHSNSLVDKFISVAPNNIFSCRTLVILKLERLCAAGNILSVDLPSLKTLHLKCVYLQNSEDLKKLISESLVLEDLYVMVGYKESASISPTRVGNGPYHVFFKAIYYNVQFLQLEVRLPNENISSYFKGSNVFPNLIHLELMFVHSYGWDDLMDVLQNCPILEILLIAKIFPKHTKNADDKSSWALKLTSISLTKWKCPNFVPKCISSHLRSCTVTFDGMLDSLRVAKYILQNAPLLQVMTVKSSKSTDSLPAEMFR